MSIFFIIFIALAVIGGVSSLIHLVNSRQNQLDTKVSNREVVELAEDHGGKITVAELAKNSNISTSEAKSKLYSMMNKGIFNYQMSSGMQEEFHLTHTIKDALRGHEKPSNLSTKHYNKKLNDSEVIKLAAASGGKITSALLCVETDISIDEAKNMLDNLQEKGVFEVQVTENGALVYELIDMDLLKNYKK